MSQELLQPVMAKIDAIEAAIKSQSDKADAELKDLGKVSTDVKTALDNLGIKQRELADELVQIKQKQTATNDTETKVLSLGDEVVKSAQYADFVKGVAPKARIEVKNTLTGSDTNVAPDRKTGVVSGAYQPLTLESFLNSTSTTSNAIEYTRESAFTNSAAETAEGGTKPESALTWALVNQPISTVAHWLKISRQLAADNVALANYVNNRLAYGVNLRVENQLGAGDGTGANIGGILKSGNFTAHGIANAALGATLKKFVLIRKMIADTWAAGFPANGILLNPQDWATLEIELLTTAAGQTLYSVADGGQPRLFGVPVIQSIGITAGQVAVGAFDQAFTIYNREGVVIDMTDSDGTDFQKNLVTVRAERRLALAAERPAAVRAGTLTPA